MFNRDKHVYTCPDTIHDRGVAKKRTRNALIAYAVFYGGVYASLKIVEARENRKPDLIIVPNPSA